RLRRCLATAAICMPSPKRAKSAGVHSGVVASPRLPVGRGRRHGHVALGAGRLAHGRMSLRGRWGCERCRGAALPPPGVAGCAGAQTSGMACILSNPPVGTLPPPSPLRAEGGNASTRSSSGTYEEDAAMAQVLVVEDDKDIRADIRTVLGTPATRYWRRPTG